jgi:hypothetical protein
MQRVLHCLDAVHRLRGWGGLSDRSESGRIYRVVPVAIRGSDRSSKQHKTDIQGAFQVDSATCDDSDGNFVQLSSPLEDSQPCARTNRDSGHERPMERPAIPRGGT